MSTYRDRRYARAERLRGWADSRETKADAASSQASRMADGIPFGQPILVGHYSEGRDRRYRARIGRQMDAAVEHGRKADAMRSKADNIEAAADHAIYSDDVDAVERLEERIAGLEAERDRIKRYNASARKAKGAGDVSILDETQRADLLQLVRIGFDRHGQFPAFATSNLSGQISTKRKRLAALRGLVTCREHGCGATFLPVEGREPYCIDHAAERDRAANGWTPEHSVD